MNISNAQSLIGLIGNDNIPSIVNLKNCINSLGKICSCQKSRKSQKSEECNNIYINFVNTQTQNLVEYFKTKTRDDIIIFTHGSNHEIRRLKLR